MIAWIARLAGGIIVPAPPKIVEGKKRHKDWPKFRKAHLKDHPRCEFCGKNDDLDLHHERPYHLYPELEMDPGNVMTACRHDHWIWCHLGDWKAWNPKVRDDAMYFRELRGNRTYGRVA